MSGATGRSPSVQSRIEETHVRRSQETKVRNGDVQMNDSTKPSGTHSRPVTRYRLFKPLAATDYITSGHMATNVLIAYFQAEIRTHS